MKTLAELVVQVAVGSVLSLAAYGCSASASDQAVNNRDRAANARVTAADAHIKATEADARLPALANRVNENKAHAKRVIPSGTLLKVFLIDAIDSSKSSPGDRFLASLAESVVINGATLLPKGTRVRGRVIHAERAGKANGRALIHLDLIDIVRGNRPVAIETGIHEATGAGNGVVLATKGNEIHYDPETRLDFTLTSSVDL